jgi:AcrR family transcriptional regulator
MSRPARVSREAWLELGRGLLAREGVAALTVERLTAAAGATRGSFYHHFDGMPAFVDALVDFWIAESTERILQALDAAPAEQRRVLLTRMAYSVDMGLERGIRQLAQRDTTKSIDGLAARLAQVDDSRERTLQTLVETDFGHPPEEAATIARLLNTIFVGVVHRDPADPHAFVKGMLSWVETVLAHQAPLTKGSSKHS